MALRKSGVKRIKEELNQITVLVWRDNNGYYLRHVNLRHDRKGRETLGRVLVRAACLEFFLVTGIRLEVGQHRYYKFTPVRSARRLPAGCLPSDNMN